ncbi:MAG: hypothetical protein IJN16_09935 [Lachnospiraceae bacterium]|nr:hypothetical protein [Lachnospiraceae bacterium]
MKTKSFRKMVLAVTQRARKKITMAASIVVAGSMMAFCANGIEDIVNKLGILGFGILELVGVFQLVTGIVAFVKTMTGDDDHGADQNSISKAIKKVIAGALMVFGPIIVLAWIGATPNALGTHFFGGL